MYYSTSYLTWCGVITLRAATLPLIRLRLCLLAVRRASCPLPKSVTHSTSVQTNNGAECDLNRFNTEYWSTVIVLTVSVNALANVYQVPLRRIESEQEKLWRLGLWPRHSKEKCINLDLEDRLPDSATQIVDYGGAEYIAELTVGTPEQKFRVIMDTGSANFYIPDVSCQGYRSKACENSKCDPGLACKVFCPHQMCCQKFKGAANGCNKKNLFNATASTSYVNMEGQWNVQYPPLDAEGFLGNDTVRLGAIGSEQLVVPGTVFGRATKFSSSFASNEIDGVLGLAFPVIASSRITPPISRAIQLHLLDLPLFTVYLRAAKGKKDVDGGTITFGALDTTHCGPVIAYEPLTTPTHWQFQLTAVTSGNFHSNIKCRARSSTASSYIEVPAEELDAIANEHGAKWDKHLQCHVVECTSKPTLELTIGQHNYTIESQNLVVQIPDGRCILALKPSPRQKHGKIWILGVPFHRQYCTIHDFEQERIGFAESINY